MDAAAAVGAGADVAGAAAGGLQPLTPEREEQLQTLRNNMAVLVGSFRDLIQTARLGQVDGDDDDDEEEDPEAAARRKAEQARHAGPRMEPMADQSYADAEADLQKQSYASAVHAEELVNAAENLLALTAQLKQAYILNDRRRIGAEVEASTTRLEAQRARNEAAIRDLADEIHDTIDELSALPEL